MIWHLRVKSPKTGVGRHALPTKSGSLLPAALYLFLPELRPRTCGHRVQRGTKPNRRISTLVRSASLRTTRFASCFILVPRPTPGGVSKGGALPSVPRLLSPWGVGFQRGGPRPPAFVPFQGGAGGNRNPPAFLFRGPGGHSLFKREYPPGFSVPKRYSSAGNPGNLFGKTKRKWGFNPVRHSRTSPYQSGAFDVSKENVGCILRGKAALPAANRRLSTDRPGSAAYSCTGDRPAPGLARRWEWRGCGCPPPPRSGW